MKIAIYVLVYDYMRDFVCTNMNIHNFPHSSSLYSAAKSVPEEDIPMIEYTLNEEEKAEFLKKREKYSSGTAYVSG